MMLNKSYTIENEDSAERPFFFKNKECMLLEGVMWLFGSLFQKALNSTIPRGL